MTSRFTFISTAGPNLDPANARSVRAHTTRANFARRRLLSTRLYTAQRPEHELNPEYGDLKFHYPLLAHKLHPLTSSLPQNSLILLEYCESADSLFENSHSYNIVLHTLQPMIFPPQRSILLEDSNAISRDIPTHSSLINFMFCEPAMLEATICLAARTCHSRTNNRISLRLSYDHKSRTIRTVNEYLSNQPGMLSDGIVGAVFTLALISVCEPHPSKMVLASFLISN